MGYSGQCGAENPVAQEDYQWMSNDRIERSFTLVS
jgi:hypothetical protein